MKKQRDPKDVILKGLKKDNNLSISDMVRDLPLSRGQIRVALAFLLGSGKIEEVKYGMAKVYFLEGKK